MKLDGAVIKHLQQLDVERGGGFTIESGRINTIDKPILLVGLGGTGVESLIRAKKMINRRFKLADGQDKPSNVEFLAIDTDDNNSYINYQGIEFSKENKEFALLDNSKLTSIYKNRDVVLNEDSKWLSNNLRLQQVKHGAGGIRQAGRLMLFINIEYIIDIISEKLHKLILNRSTNGSIYVFILSGLSGGTGSGCFVDIAYLIRTLAEQKGFSTENIGMLFLPDVTLTNNSIDASASQNIKANGFASFKELDYLMNIEYNGERFKQAYSDINVNSNEPPFDLCNLISSKDQNGKIISGAKEYCMNVVSETIINFIASEVISSGQNYTLTSYLSNIENNRTTFITNLKVKHPVNYVYNIVGAASSVLSIDNITNYFVSLLFNEVDNLYKNNPLDEDINEVTQKSGLEIEYLERFIIMNRPQANDLNSLNFYVISQKADIVEDAVKSDYLKTMEYFKTRSLEFTDKLLPECIENILNEHFSNLEKGPFYVTKEITDIINKINNIREKVIPGKRVPDFEIQNVKMESDKIKSKISKGGFMIGKNNLAKKHKDYCRQYYQLLSKNDMYRQIDKLYEASIAYLTKLNDKFDTLCELIMKLRELFDHSKFLANQAAKPGFGVDIIDTKEFVDALIESSQNDISLNVNLNVTMVSLLKEIMINHAEWLDTANPSIAKNLSKFVSSSFDNILNRSMDFYLNIIAQKQGINFDKYIDMKINELKAMSTVMFPMSSMPAAMGINFPPYSYLAVPSNSPSLRQKCESAFAHGLSGNLKISNMANRMFMLNLSIGVPLFCYSELVDYEKAYEMANQALIPGIHLCESEDNNWRDLPSPNYEKLWVNGYENKREQSVIKRKYEAFDKAKKYGYIKWDAKRALYKCSYGEILDIDALLTKYDVDLSINAIYSHNSRILLNELKAYLNDDSRLIYTTYIYDADVDINDDEFTKGIFLQMPKLNSDIEKHVIMHERLEEIISKLSLIDEEELSYSNFAKIMYTGCIYRVRKNYKYTDSKNNEQTIYTIDNLKNNYEEYNLFTAFGKLTKKDSAYLQKAAASIENDCNEEELIKVISSISAHISEYKQKYESITKQLNLVKDGKMKSEFYKAMIEVFEKSKELLL